MPASTKHKKPVIVYLDLEDYEEVERRAKQDDRSVSAMARWLIHTALRDRRAVRQAIEDP